MRWVAGVVHRALLIVGLTGCRFHFDPLGPDDAGAAGEQVDVIVVGHGIALVAGQPACADQCTYSSGPLELSVMAGEGWELAAFSAPCSAQQTCTAPAGSAITVTFRLAPITAAGERERPQQ